MDTCVSVPRPQVFESTNIKKQVENAINKDDFKTNIRSFAWCQNNAEIQKHHKWLAIILKEKDVCFHCIKTAAQCKALIIRIAAMSSQQMMQPVLNSLLCF